MDKQSLKQKVFGTKKAPSLGSKFAMGIFVITVALVGIAVAFGLVTGARTRNLADDSTYQAVFLQNGQVYFGKLSSIDQNYVRLSDVYYLQTGEAEQKDSEEQPKVQLNKLGNELHGPRSEMYIVRDNISFWENLKSDSKVVEAINNQSTTKANGTSTNQSTSTETQPTTQPQTAN